MIHALAACFFIVFFSIYFQGGEACFTLKLFNEQHLEALLILLGVLSPSAVWSMELHRRKRKIARGILKWALALLIQAKETQKNKKRQTQQKSKNRPIQKKGKK